MMNLTAAKIFLLVLLSAFIANAFAQKMPAPKWDAPKIKGIRQESYSIYEGKPYFTDKWCVGNILLTNGESIDSLYMRYSSFKDELIYFNSEINIQIKIDKTIISAFSFADENGQIRRFRKQQFDNSSKSERYFEVLSEGNPALLCYRKVNLNEVSAYRDTKGALKNMAYQQEYLYYFYSPQKGYISVKPNKKGLLACFDKESQKPVKKLLRKNRISPLDEFSFVAAWEIIKSQGFSVMF
jgi:hypothetical protein